MSIIQSVIFPVAFVENSKRLPGLLVEFKFVIVWWPSERVNDVGVTRSSDTLSANTADNTIEAVTLSLVV